MNENKIEEIILVDQTVTGEINLAKNLAIKHIMRAVELVIDKEHPKRRDVRNIVLDEINLYHRTICKIIEESIKGCGKCG